MIFIQFWVFYLTFVHLWCSWSKMTVIRNEWVRLQLVYKIEFRHMAIHQMDTIPLPDPHMHVCLSAHTHTSLPFLASMATPTGTFPQYNLCPTGTTPVGILTNNRNIVSITLFLEDLVHKAFLRPCSQFILWQHNDQTIYCR